MKTTTVVVALFIVTVGCSKTAPPNEQQLRRTLEAFTATATTSSMGPIVERCPAKYTLQSAGPALPIMANEPNTITYPFVWYYHFYSDPGKEVPSISGPTKGASATFTKGADGSWYLTKVTARITHSDSTDCWGCQLPLSVRVQ